MIEKLTSTSKSPVMKSLPKQKQVVLRVEDVASFVPTGGDGKFASRLLVDGESVGSENLVVNHFTLKVGQKTYCGHHPHPFEEVYYILRGQGVLTLGKERHSVGPDTIIYIAAMEDHQLENVGSEDLEMLTMMPKHPIPGVNTVYDERRTKWGTSFRLRSDGERQASSVRSAK